MLDSVQMNYRLWAVASVPCICASTCMATGVKQLNVADQFSKPCVLAPAYLQHRRATSPSTGLQDAQAWLHKWETRCLSAGGWRQRKRAMPEMIWDAKASGDKKAAVSRCYGKLLGWWRVLLNDLCPSWWMMSHRKQTSRR